MRVLHTPSPAIDDEDADLRILAPVQSAALQPSPVTRSRRVRRAAAHGTMRALLLAYRMALAVAKRVGRTQRSQGAAVRVLLTGTFHADNWVAAHVRPLAESSRCTAVTLVSTRAVAPMPNVTVVQPPMWLTRTIGGSPARLVTFAWSALRHPPDVIGGFHLLLNGLAAALVGRLVGARPMYFCVGGPMEVVDGGIHAENRLFGLMETADPIVERRLIHLVNEFDLVITMGTRAIEFYRSRGVDAAFHVVAGGIDARFSSVSETDRSIDLILVGRLVPIKRVALFLRAVRCAADRKPGIRAVVVGDGPERAALERLSQSLGLSDMVAFVGHQRDVHGWLIRSKVFVLTSASEGLALSMMEAMTYGLPAIVTNVGDLGDLVDDGRNGYLIDHADPEAFAERIVALIDDPKRYASFSRAARDAARRHQIGRVARQWDVILAEQGGLGPDDDGIACAANR